MTRPEDSEYYWAFARERTRQVDAAILMGGDHYADLRWLDRQLETDKYLSTRIFKGAKEAFGVGKVILASLSGGFALDSVLDSTLPDDWRDK